MSSWLGGGGGSSAPAAGGGGGGSAAKTYKLLCISILRWCPPGDAEEPVLLDAAYNLAEYSFFTRGGVQEFMAFACRTVMKRLTAGTNAIDYEGNHLYCVVQSDGLGIIVMTDKNYPGRVAVKLARDMLEAFKAAHSATWRTCKAEMTQKLPKLEQSLQDYQDPAQMDKLLKVDQQLNQTKEILLQTIDKVLQRGEKLDDLVEKSKNLTDASKVFYKQARKTNSCCVIM